MNPIQLIESRENPKIKNALRIKAGKNEGFVFIEGWRLAEEAVRSETKITACFILKTLGINPKFTHLLDLFAQKKIEIFEVEEKVFSMLADTKNSQGLILIAETPAHGRELVEKSFELAKHKLLVYLSEINNPANLGAILRTAEAAGVAGIITSKNSTYIFSPKTMRSAMGANLRLPVWIGAEFDEVLDLAEKLHLRTTAADVKSAESYINIDWKLPRLLIFGSEAHGLPDDKINLSSEKIYIPMSNGVESLNLAVSCGIILFEWKNQR